MSRPGGLGYGMAWQVQNAATAGRSAEDARCGAQRRLERPSAPHSNYVARRCQKRTASPTSNVFSPAAASLS
jgi:hypothetical protein